ncbi:hypothetical protein IWQ61_010514, partial [Dispira simplex]
MEGCHLTDPTWERFKDWLNRKRFPTPQLALAEFPTTGRGLMVTQPVAAGDTLVEVPGALLLTRSAVGRVWQKRYNIRWVEIQRRFQPSEQTVLVLALVLERRMSSQSPLYPYLQVLPTDFPTVPLAHVDAVDIAPDHRHWTNGYPILLTGDLKRLLEDQVKSSLQALATAHDLLAALAGDTLTLEEWHWGWLVVNTRCISLRAGEGFRPPSSNLGDSLALAPLLDLLNHDCQADVTPYFDHSRQSFIIRTNQPVLPGNEAFINYGPHDNVKLVCEYGFWVPGNPHDLVPLDDILMPYFTTARVAEDIPTQIEPGVARMARNRMRAQCLYNHWITRCMQLLQNTGMWGDYHLTAEDVSYRTTATMLLLVRIPPIRDLSVGTLPAGDHWVRFSSADGTQDTITSIVALDRYFAQHRQRWQEWCQGLHPEWSAEVQPHMARWVNSLCDQVVRELDQCLAQLATIPAPLE